MHQIDWFIEQKLETYFSIADRQRFYKKSELADLFVKAITEQKNEIDYQKFTYSQIQEIQSQFSTSEHLIFIILARLKRQNKLRTDESLSTFSFFPKQSVDGLDSSNFITETENVTHQLEQSLSQIKNAINSKESKIKNFKNQALAAKKLNDKISAINFMKKAKVFEKSLDNLLQQSSNLENLLLQIETKKDEQMILESLKLGSDMLAELNKENQVEKIEAAMADVQENLEHAEEISQVFAENVSEINLNGLGQGASDELELEAELKDLMKNEENEEKVEVAKEVEQFCKEFDDLEKRFAALKADEAEPLPVTNINSTEKIEPCLV